MDVAAHLQHAAHPLEAVLLRRVWPLLGHQHDPVIVQHRHGEHGDPGRMRTKMTPQQRTLLGQTPPVTGRRVEVLVCEDSATAAAGEKLGSNQPLTSWNRLS